ncbi:MAG: class I SAM-dependent methyltransferase [Candidatus Portnoybacteria bacterium]|nr:class I SAM-dependent methyltransferase [Candidatus Portnoybacteria bacterium]MDD4982481.1 class I SAM-dependent methyltransferase [Candidatus Portnoybacteria bacterium]
MANRENEYLEKGDYHKNLDNDWRFFPVYVAKMRLVEKTLTSLDKSRKIIDLGCGEGVLVEKFKERGYDIVGLDLNYESEFVLKRGLTRTGFADNSFDTALCLCVLEHLSFEDQEAALKEIKRILKPGGTLILTLSNLAHFASRFTFFFLGRLIRTSEAKRHISDRPIAEYLELLREFKFTIKKRRGLFPTFPVSSLLTYFFPSRMVGWHRILNIFAWPNWSFLNFLVCENEKN